MKTALDGAVTSINGMKDKVVDPAKSLDSLYDNLNSNKDSINMALKINFFVMFFLAGLSICGQLISKKCKRLGRCMIKISWFVSGILGIIGLLFSGIYCIVVLATNDACVALENILASKANFDELNQGSVPTDLVDYLNVCIWSDGDMATKLGIDTYTAEISTMFTEFDKLDALKEPNGTIQQLMSNPSVACDAWKGLITKALAG